LATWPRPRGIGRALFSSFESPLRPQPFAGAGRRFHAGGSRAEKEIKKACIPIGDMVDYNTI